MNDKTGQKPKRVLVTGGTGFVGAYLCKTLAANGQTPIAAALEDFSGEACFLLGAPVDFLECDVTDQQSVERAIAEARPDAIIHTAGIVGHDASLANPVGTYAVNVMGTAHVLETARKAGISKVVILSSNAAYQKRQRDFFDESHPITSTSEGNPNAHYGTSKMAGEQIGLAYRSFHGMDVLALRITSVYGFSMKKGQMQLKQMVETAVKGGVTMLPSGGAVRRDYTYVVDTVDGIMRALNTDTRHLQDRVFNISRCELSSNLDIADAVRGAVPGARIEIAAEMTAFETATLAQRVPLVYGAAEQAFGYRPHYAIKEGIQDYVRLYQAYLQSAGVPERIL